jgi:hypothetical protein
LTEKKSTSINRLIIQYFYLPANSNIRQPVCRSRNRMARPPHSIHRKFYQIRTGIRQKDEA